MQHRSRFLCGLALVLTLSGFLTAPALGDLANGDFLFETNSSLFGFNVSIPADPYDLVAMRINPAYQGVASFLPPNSNVDFWALGDFFGTPLPGWDHTVTQPYLLTGEGPTRTSMSWSVLFSQDFDVHFDLDIVFFDGDTLQRSFKFPWRNAGSTSFQSGDWFPERAEVIPSPGAATLGLLGMGLVAFKRRRGA